MNQSFDLTAPIVIGIGLSILTGIILSVLGLFVKKKTPAPKADETILKRAVVLCAGVNSVSPSESEYQGHPSCKEAKQFFGGPKNCKYGCIGLGDCAKACPEKAISTCNGIAIVDRDKCNGCGICKDICPQKLIKLFPKSQLTLAACSSKDHEELRLQVCKASCVKCGACAIVCPFNAINLDSSVARIDPNKCVNCGECKKVCPQKCIVTAVN